MCATLEHSATVTSTVHLADQECNEEPLLFSREVLVRGVTRQLRVTELLSST